MAKRNASGIVQPITEEELEQKLESFRKAITEETKSAMQNLENKTQNHVTELVKSVSAIQARRMENIEGEVSHLKSSQDKLQKDQLSMWEQIAKLEKSLALSEKDAVEIASIENDSFNREPILHKLKLGSIFFIRR